MAEPLEKYNQKRNFTKTPEPEGVVINSKEKLRFVVQHHLASRDHFDFRLEWEGTLLSWAVPKGPSYYPRDKRLAVKVEDHPFEYRNFEGTIPKGEYGGGTVMLWDEGYWEPEVDVADGLINGSLKFTLTGKRLKGRWALVRMKKSTEKNHDNWLLLKEKDTYAQTSDGISEFQTSIRTNLTMEDIANNIEIKNKNPFQQAEVQLAKLENHIPEEDDWLYEMKYDGYRILAYIENHDVKLMTRNGNDYTKRFQKVATSLIDWAVGRAMVLDGEMVIVDEKGKTDFQALQNYMRNPISQHLTYIVFDLLTYNGLDYREKPLIQRKETLEQLMQDAPNNIHYSKHVWGKGKECFEIACQSGMEGIVGKRANSLYQGTKNGDWIKIKCENRQEFVIGGFTLSDKKANGISSLLLGVYEEKELVYVGRAGTGLGQLDVDILEKSWKNLKKKQSPFKLAPKQKSNETITWLQPDLVVEIKFAEWTNENLLRQASFKGLRTDKNPMDVHLEKTQ